VVSTYRSCLSCLCLLLALLCTSTSHAQETTAPAANNASEIAMNAPPPPPTRPTADLIIRNFVAAETKLRETLVQFSFKREVVLQTLGAQEKVTGEYIRNSVFVLDDRGERVEQVLYHPKPTIKELKITREDIQDLAGSQLFGVELTDLNSYNLSYLGEENLDGHLRYLIAVSPRQVPDARHMHSRFFVGRFWIDPVTFQAVCVEGTTEPHGKQRFPTFKTARQIETENLRFPSSTSADDVLRFPHKDVHYRITIRYYDFKRFAGRVKIVEID
jgi:hypothetical protein